MKLKKIYHYFLLLICSTAINAQIYPVQVNTTLVPPYLTTVSDYSTTLNEKFVANLFTSDLTVSQRQIQLKLSIEGNNIQATSTPIINGYQPLYLNGGESLKLTNVDLEAYFRLENLQGINPIVYSNSLPQGLYKFCIEIIDYNTQIKISQKSCAMAYFIVNDPPFLNLPSNHENIPSQDPQNIVFTWTPRHLNATNIEYEYTLVDLQDNQAPSNYAFVVTPPLFQATTNNTILLYGPSQPLLTIGKKYAWRVQAKTQSGFGDTAAFQNNGYSEIYDFIFQGNCDKPTFVLAEALSNSQVKITWQTNPNHLNYIVQYRKKDTNQWFDIEATTNEVKLYDLEPLAVYEFRVGGYCTGNVLTFSNTNEFTQPANNVNVVNCGVSPDIDLSNQQLYNGNLGEGETFLAGDFPVHVTESTNASGTYSGKGWTKAPYLNSIRLAVLFNDIKLNTDKKLLQGEVKAVYDPTWSNIADINVIVDQVENVLDVFQQSIDVHTHSVPFVIGSATNITVVNGQIVIVNPATGQTGMTYDHDTGEMTTITDANGSVYNVSPTGQVQQVGVGIGIPSATNTENVAANGSVSALSNVGIQVTFKKSNISGKESIAAEDKGVSSSAPAKIKALYKTIKDGQSNDYPLYYKAVINKEDGNPSFEYVIAEIKITNSNVKIDSLIFNKKGVKVVAENLPNDGTTIRRLLKVPAFTTVGEDQVLALLKNGNQKQKVVGAMVAIPIKDVGAVNVTLIPVNGATITAETTNQLKAIYSGTGATLNTTIAANYSSTKTTMDCGSSGFFANYTSDQKAFINDYKAANPAESDQYYIFVTKNISPTGRQLNGFMPLHRQFGFVFGDQTTGNEVKNDDVSGLASVIAHELGHGAFELEHPWEKFKYSQGSGTTPWLMDYDSGTQLPFKDWQTISHPKDKLYIFQSDESGAQIDVQSNYLMPNNLPFRFLVSAKTNLENSIIVDTNANGGFANGTLYSFKIDNKIYKYVDGKFLENGTGLIYENQYKNSFRNIDFKLIVYSATNNCEYVLVYRKVANLQQPNISIPAKAIKYLLCDKNEISLAKDFTEAEQSAIFSIWFYINNCIEAYKLQTEGYVPRCLWDHNNYVPTGTFIPYNIDPAMISGVIDGALEMGKGVYDIATFIKCIDPTSVDFWLKKSCFDLRTKTGKVIGELTDLLADSVLLNKAFEGIGTSFNEYLSETVAISNQARYNQGKLIFNIASLFFGVGEANAIVKGETTLLKVVQASLKSYAAIPKSIAKLMQRASNSGLAYVALKTGNKGAYLAYKLANSEVKLAEFTVNNVFIAAKTIATTEGTVVLETLDNIPYLDVFGNIKNTTFTVVEKDADVFVHVQGTGNLFDLSVFKNLTARIPGGANKTNIGKTLFDDALKYKPSSGNQKILLDDILTNGDNAIDGVASGSKTELLVKDILESQNYKYIDGKYFGETGSNGFDGVFIKGTLENPTEIIIVECKQLKTTGNVVLNSPASTGLPAQMSDDWINYMAREKLLNIGGDKTTLARKILNSQPEFIKKYVVAVDKTAGEVNFLKLGNY